MLQMLEESWLTGLRPWDPDNVMFLICVLGIPGVSSRQTRLMIINHDGWKLCDGAEDHT